ncbi:hypothetical protein [Aurantimicrobium minutum]|uniref:Uncharacterized protein n=1 Tax=Aurantimicrobium minutum TaxID=708131 RepID=A0A173LYC9_9MICO|nr:hypothetical protein [Aurantimicrobium minutum]BAU99986.1 Uncharacterized protein AUMI_114440 [Aurantimicrobium minutum]
MYCSNCGEKRVKGNFCPSCGERFPDNQATQEVPEVLAHPEAPQVDDHQTGKTNPYVWVAIGAAILLLIIFVAASSNASQQESARVAASQSAQAEADAQQQAEAKRKQAQAAAEAAKAQLAPDKDACTKIAQIENSVGSQISGMSRVSASPIVASVSMDIRSAASSANQVQSYGYALADAYGLLADFMAIDVVEASTIGTVQQASLNFKNACKQLG